MSNSAWYEEQARRLARRIANDQDLLNELRRKASDARAIEAIPNAQVRTPEPGPDQGAG